MAPTRIDDPDDPRLAAYRNIPDPELLARGGLFIAEGRLVVRRLLRESRFVTQSVLVTPAALPAIRDVLDEPATPPVFVVPQAVMNQVAGFNIHRGCLALGHRGPLPPLEAIATGARRLIVVERIANPDNIGGIFRNAAAFGADGVILDAVSTDPLYRKAIRTSVGTALLVPFARAADWSTKLRALGMLTVALTPSRNAVPLREAAPRLRQSRVALVLGHEGDGLTQYAMDACDLRVRIATSDLIDSLNVAVAAGIALYEISDRL